IKKIMETKKAIIRLKIDLPLEADIDNMETKIFDDLDLLNALIKEYQSCCDSNNYHFLESNHRWMFANYNFKKNIDEAIKENLQLDNWKFKTEDKVDIFEVYILTQNCEILIYSCPIDKETYRNDPYYEEIYEKINKLPIVINYHPCDDRMK